MNINSINLQGFYNKIEKRAFAHIGTIAKDTVSFKGIPYRYEDDDKKLFKDCTLKKMRNFNDIKPENLSLIHITNYFPNNGEILSLKEASKNSDGAGECRSTVHFSLNQSVERDNTQINWASMKYAVILPFEKVLRETPQEKIGGGKYGDFFFIDSVKLPEGSKIVKYNKSIQDGKFRISEAKDENGIPIKGVELVETSNPDMCAAAQRVSEKMGYSAFDDIFYTTEEAKVDAKKLKDFMNTGDFSKIIPGSNEFEEFLELSNRVNIQKAETMEQLEKVWDIFCSDINCCNLEQGFNNPWTKSDSLIHFIGNVLIDSNDNSWLYRNGEITVDFKDLITGQIDEIEEMLPKNKKLGFDIQKLKQIVIKSDTPAQAIKTVEKELKITPITMFDDNAADNDAYQYFTLVIAANSVKDINNFIGLESLNLPV